MQPGKPNKSILHLNSQKQILKITYFTFENVSFSKIIYVTIHLRLPLQPMGKTPVFNSTIFLFMLLFNLVLSNSNDFHSLLRNLCLKKIYLKCYKTSQI